MKSTQGDSHEDQFSLEAVSDKSWNSFSCSSWTLIFLPSQSSSAKIQLALLLLQKSLSPGVGLWPSQWPWCQVPIHQIMVQNPQTLVKPSPASSPPTIFPQWICPIWSGIFSCRTGFAFKEMNSSCQASVHYGSIHAFWIEIIYWARSTPVHSRCSHIFENRGNIEHPLIISIIKSPRIPQTLFDGSWWNTGEKIWNPVRVKERLTTECR